MQTGQLCTHCSHNGESAKNIQNEVYKKPCVCICVYHKRIKDTFFFLAVKKMWTLIGIFYQFMANSFSDLLNFWKCH